MNKPLSSFVFYNYYILLSVQALTMKINLNCLAYRLSIFHLLVIFDPTIFPDYVIFFSDNSHPPHSFHDKQPFSLKL